MAVTKPLGLLVCISLLLSVLTPARAAVLPADRADVMYHSYDGGGVKIDGPAVLVRKSITDDVSVSAQYYVDEISGASIDVEVLASEYAEERTQYDVGADYLLNKTIISLGYSNSTENDYEADTYSLGISQDFFGDLSTLSLSFALGNDTVKKSTDPLFEEDKTTQSYQFSWTQVMTKNLLMNFIYHVITDEGYLNNPYRSYRFLNGSSVGWLTEKYPETRTSHAFAVRGRYFMPYRAAFGFEYRRFNDTWGINAYNMDLSYTHPWGEHWIFDVHYRYYSQSDADFYSDLFPSADFQNYMGRDKELSTYTNNTVGFKISYEIDTGWSHDWLEKASVTLAWDILSLDYENFRDARRDDLPPGTEPMYSFDADVVRFFISAWF
ncbi:MAG: DUF3570 domain-containing protein [Pseudomonadota bacterium]|nr:DUF3570 domain-containing protein [Pseudomonadota bacterium]